MTAVDNNSRIAVSLRQAIHSVEELHLEQRQVDRSLSYAAGQIAAYEAVRGGLKSKDRKVVNERIFALKIGMGDLS